MRLEVSLHGPRMRRHQGGGPRGSLLAGAISRERWNEPGHSLKGHQVGDGLLGSFQSSCPAPLAPIPSLCPTQPQVQVLSVEATARAVLTEGLGHGLARRSGPFFVGTRKESRIAIYDQTSRSLDFWPKPLGLWMFNWFLDESLPHVPFLNICIYIYIYLYTYTCTYVYKQYS